MAYGRELLRVLPPARRLNGRWAELLEEIRHFYNPLSALGPRHSALSPAPRASRWRDSIAVPANSRVVRSRCARHIFAGGGAHLVRAL